MRERIGIFGGSFNPPHNGHIEIARYFLQHRDVDKIWVIPCFVHPFGKTLASYDDRLAMCKFAFGQFRDKIKVSDIEREIGGISITIKTIERLQQDHPEKKFSLILGGDTKGEVTQWADSNRIFSIIDFLTVPRGPKSFIPDISSTQIRQNIADGKKFDSLVPREVAVYIITHGLYH